ncbi:histidine kinase N-terminal 7TM domain-containing protein [Haloferax sp. S1W]|uniref:histidine kinase N-terminal 7TM domain-containing protein n=1 Tax=Haloferax sp. S1W TaxID=3377110 RepID=UPI0037C99AC5
MSTNVGGVTLWEKFLISQPATVVAAVLLLMLASGAISIGVTVYTWRNRKTPGATGLSVLAAASGLWSIGYFIELLVSDIGLKLLVANIEWAGVLVAPIAWFVFTFSYTGRDRYTAPGPLMVISFLPMLTLIAVWTNPAHHLMWTTTEVVSTANGVITMMQHEWGPLYWVILGYSYLLWLAGALVLFRTMLDMPQVYRLQAVTLILGTLMPVLGNFATTLLELYGAAIDMTPAAFAFAGLSYAIALSRYDLLGSRPVPRAIACERIVKSMADAVVVTDTKWRVIALNKTAEEILERPAETLKGHPISDIISGTDSTQTNVGNVAVKLGESQRDFELLTSTFTDHHGRPIGSALVFRDVTDRRRNMQQLEVMNRVLRHNLRTEANMLFGYADLVTEALANGSTDRAGRYAKIVRDRAFSLVNISEKAKKLATLQESIAENQQGELVPVEKQLQRAANAVEDEHPECVITVKPSLNEHVVSSSALENVVQELIENGVVHNYSDVPTVWVQAFELDDTIEIHVVDDGPGINPNELVAIRAHGETPLQHGSGLGLWLVTWGVDQLGGEVSFERTEEGGTDAILRIPVRRQQTGGEETDSKDRKENTEATNER